MECVHQKIKMAGESKETERIKLNQEIIKFKEDRILDFFLFFPF